MTVAHRSLLWLYTRISDEPSHVPPEQNYAPGAAYGHADTQSAVDMAEERFKSLPALESPLAFISVNKPLMDVPEGEIIT